MRFSFLNHDFVASADDRRELRLKREVKMVIEKWKVLYRVGGDSSELEMKKITISSLIAKYCFVRIVLHI